MFAFVSLVLMAPPAGIPIQGRLANGAGGVAPDGDYGLTLRLYAAAGDAVPLAVDVQPAVPIRDGVFSTVIGQTVPVDPEIFRSANAAWVGVQVGSEPELPRQPLRTVPYAVHAQVASDVRCTGCVTPEETSFMACVDGSILVRSGGTWGCAPRPSGSDFALSGQQCPAGQLLRGVKADGSALCAPDNDTTYSGANFAISSAGCAPGQVMVGVSADGSPACAPDKDTTYSGANFALSAQTCGANQVMRGVDAAGKPVCAPSMPAGLIGFFLGSCPSGWTEVTELRGRTLLGTPAGGEPGLSVGTALGNGGQRQISEVPAHSHAADPGAFSSANAGDHSHSVDPPGTSTSDAGAHSHSADPPDANTSTNGSHSHTGFAPGHDSDSANSQGYPAGNNHNSFRTTDRGREHAMSGGAISTNGDHQHSVDVPAFSTGTSGGHSHSVDIGGFSSASGGSHTHTVDVPAFSTGSTGSVSVDVTMPYLQLTACRFTP